MPGWAAITVCGCSGFSGQVASSRSANGGTNASSREARNTTRRPTGNIKAPPRPWITRAPISMLRVCDSAQSREPKLNSRIALKKIFLVPKRSAIQPDAGISSATVSM